MDCKGIIFDMDGTLIDSMGMWRSLATIFLADNELEPKEAGLDEKVYLMTVPEMRQFFEKEYGLRYHTLADFQEAYYHAVYCYYRTVIRPRPGVFAFLQKIRDAGIRMCVATATRTQSAMLALKRLGFLDYMEFVLCCGDVGAEKDQPDIYLEAARRMGCSVSECVVFEDALYCIRTAKKAGFRTVGIYEKSAPWEAECIRAVCDLYIEGYEDLLNLPEEREARLG